MILKFDKKIGPLSLLKGLLFQLGGIQGDTQWQIDGQVQFQHYRNGKSKECSQNFGNAARLV